MCDCRIRYYGRLWGWLLVMFLWRFGYKIMICSLFVQFAFYFHFNSQSLCRDRKKPHKQILCIQFKYLWSNKFPFMKTFSSFPRKLVAFCSTTIILMRQIVFTAKFFMNFRLKRFAVLRFRKLTKNVQLNALGKSSFKKIFKLKFQQSSQICHWKSMPNRFNSSQLDGVRSIHHKNRASTNVKTSRNEKKWNSRKWKKKLLKPGCKHKRRKNLLLLS